MEASIRAILLQCAGWVAMASSLGHGALGETKVFPRASIEPKQLATLIHGVWQAGTVAWIGRGALMAAAPWMGSDVARHWIIIQSAVVFGSAALGNAWALRGRHVGWVAMSAVVALAFAG